MSSAKSVKSATGKHFIPCVPLGSAENRFHRRFHPQLCACDLMSSTLGNPSFLAYLSGRGYPRCFLPPYDRMQFLMTGSCFANFALGWSEGRNHLMMEGLRTPPWGSPFLVHHAWWCSVRAFSCLAHLLEDAAFVAKFPDSCSGDCGQVNLENSQNFHS